MNYDTKFWHWLVIASLAVVWGSSFILMKRGLDAFDSSQVAAIRILVASVTLSPFIFKYGKLAPLKHWKVYLATGLTGNFIPAFLFTKAETGISSSLTGMLNALTPLFTLILGVLFFKSKTQSTNIIGVLLGFVGAIGLLYSDNAEAGVNMYFGLLVVLATLFYAVSVNLFKTRLNEVSAIGATVWSFLFIGPIAAFYLFSTDFTDRIVHHPLAMKSFGYVFILGAFGSAISTIIFYWLVQRTNALFSSSVTYLIPIVAIIWGVLDGESLAFIHFVWISVVLGGVYLVNKRPA